MLNLIRINALRYYRANVPVWNPSLGAYRILVRVMGRLRFLIPTMATWTKVLNRGKRSKAQRRTLTLAQFAAVAQELGYAT